MGRLMARKAQPLTPPTLEVAVWCPFCGSPTTKRTMSGIRGELKAILTCTGQRCGLLLLLSMSIRPAHLEDDGTPSKCGTEAGYQRHRRKDEEPCVGCLVAHREGNDRRRGR